MEKSADAFRTISEVADDLALPQHVLRFWETRFPQIRPLKRAGGRRYYRPADVSLLKVIRQLLYDDGYTIKGVQRLLKDQGAKGLSAGAPPRASLDWDPTIEGMDDEDAAPVPLTSSSLAVGPQGGAAGVGAAASVHGHRAAVEAALSAVDECKRILDALLRPSR